MVLKYKKQEINGVSIMKYKKGKMVFQRCSLLAPPIAMADNSNVYKNKHFQTL